MKGNNFITFNQATMIEAIEYYLNNKILRENNHVKVQSVKKLTTDFEITINSDPEKGLK